jgi:hypothetical protein
MTLPPPKPMMAMSGCMLAMGASLAGLESSATVLAGCWGLLYAAWGTYCLDRLARVRKPSAMAHLDARIDRAFEALQRGEYAPTEVVALCRERDRLEVIELLVAALWGFVITTLALVHGGWSNDLARLLLLIMSFYPSVSA